MLDGLNADLGIGMIISLCQAQKPCVTRRTLVLGDVARQGLVLIF